MFSTLYDIYFLLSTYFKMSSAISFSLDQSKIFSSGNGLNNLGLSWDKQKDVDQKIPMRDKVNLTTW